MSSQSCDASSSSSNLYNAYKAPEEKQKDVSYPDPSTVAFPVFNEKALVKDSEKESRKELDDFPTFLQRTMKNVSWYLLLLMQSKWL